MFISDKYKFVFFEVPRTGSNSVTQSFTQLDPSAPTAVERAETRSFVDYHAFKVPDVIGSPYKIIAAHRNPYERLWSFWKFRNLNGNPEIFRATSWETYVQWVCDPSSAPEIKGAMLDVPICEMFNCDQIDFWIKFESLDDSWSGLSDLLAVKLPSLAHKQQSPNLGSFRDAYNEKIAGAVADRFAIDFDRFSYDKDSWK